MPEPHEVFRKLVKELYGSHADCAAAWGVRTDSVRNWCRGRRPIPPEKWVEILNEANGHIAKMTRLVLDGNAMTVHVLHLWKVREMLKTTLPEAFS